MKLNRAIDSIRSDIAADDADAYPTDAELLGQLRQLVIREQQQMPIAEMLGRCVDGWLVTAARMAVLA